jgi:hypothetical protein
MAGWQNRQRKEERDLRQVLWAQPIDPQLARLSRLAVNHARAKARLLNETRVLLRAANLRFERLADMAEQEQADLTDAMNAHRSSLYATQTGRAGHSETAPAGTAAVSDQEIAS